jgi:hypothetical protein
MSASKEYLMPTKWFVMLRGAMGYPVPLIDLEDSIVLFDSKEKANKAGSINILGKAFGYKVFQWKNYAPQK